MKNNKGMRLVAMIEKKEDGHYEVINFLPDIKIKYQDENDKTQPNFIVEPVDNYIKIPYAQGIDDLTVIVGQNEVGKTRLVNDILSLSPTKMFLFWSNSDKTFVKFKPEVMIENYDIQLLKDLVSKVKHAELTYRGQNFKKIFFIKFSTAIELSYTSRLLSHLTKDISTSSALVDSSLYSVNITDMKRQIKFLDKHEDVLGGLINFSKKHIVVKFDEKILQTAEEYSKFKDIFPRRKGSWGGMEYRRRISLKMTKLNLLNIFLIY